MRRNLRNAFLSNLSTAVIITMSWSDGKRKTEEQGYGD